MSKMHVCFQIAFNVFLIPYFMSTMITSSWWRHIFKLFKQIISVNKQWNAITSCISTLFICFIAITLPIYSTFLVFNKTVYRQSWPKRVENFVFLLRNCYLQSWKGSKFTPPPVPMLSYRIQQMSSIYSTLIWGGGGIVLHVNWCLNVKIYK